MWGLEELWGGVSVFGVLRVFNFSVGVGFWEVWISVVWRGDVFVVRWNVFLLLVFSRVCVG